MSLPTITRAGSIGAHRVERQAVESFVLFFLGGVVLAAVAAYSWWANQKRVEALAQFCLSKGWQWSAADDGLTTRWTGAPFFQGRSRHARSVVRGEVARPNGSWPFVAFDYSYVTDSSNGKGGTDSTTHRYAICAVTLPAWLPAVTLTPENVLTRIGDSIAGDDIDLESEDFNRRYRVRAPDRKFASDVLPPRTMEMLIARPALHLRIEGRDVVCWEPGTTTPTELLARLATLTDFVAGIPDFVWHDYGGTATSTPRL